VSSISKAACCVIGKYHGYSGVWLINRWMGKEYFDGQWDRRVVLKIEGWVASDRMDGCLDG
jgi:hypothetical protein